VFPDPVAPLSWTLVGIPGAEQGWRDAYVRFGVFDGDEFSSDEIEILGVFGGYCYLNVSVSRIFGVRVPGLTPEMVDYSLFGEQPDVLPYRAAPSDESPEHSARVGETLGWILTTQDLPELAESQQQMEELRAARPDLSKLDDHQLVERTRQLFGEWFRKLFAEHLFTSYCAMVPLGILTTVCGAIGQPELAMKLVAGVGGVDSAAPSFAMWELSRVAAASKSLSNAFDEGVDGLLDRLRDSGDEDSAAFIKRFDGFLYEFGSRGPNEWEMRCPTWETHPELALIAIDRMRGSSDDAAPAGHHHALAAEREAVGATVIEALAQDPEAQGQFQAGLAAAAIFLAGRERSKTNIVRLVQECRVLMHEFGRRMVAAGHFENEGNFGMLTEEELLAFLDDPTPFKDVIREREERFAELAGLVPPFVLNGEYTPTDRWPGRNQSSVDSATAGTVLQGISGCPGQATGRARVILDPFHGGELEPGEVLVAPITDPSWTPLFVTAAGVVVDVGAQLSHAIIVSRELGIPCVVSVTDGTRRIHDGALVRVDGTNGTVTILEDA
jgi:pyruvate,water dikinase